MQITTFMFKTQTHKNQFFAGHLFKYLSIYALLKELHSSYYYDAEDDYIPEAGKYASKQTTTTAM